MSSSSSKSSGKAKSFRHESLQDSRSIVRYLNALAEGFEKGMLQFRDQEGEIVLEPNGMIRFGISAEQKSDRCDLALKLSWKQSRADAEQDSGPLTITGLLRESQKAKS